MIKRHKDLENKTMEHISSLSDDEKDLLAESTEVVTGFLEEMRNGMVISNDDLTELVMLTIGYMLLRIKQLE